MAWPAREDRRALAGRAGRESRNVARAAAAGGRPFAPRNAWALLRSGLRGGGAPDRLRRPLPPAPIAVAGGPLCLGAPASTRRAEVRHYPATPARSLTSSPTSRLVASGISAARAVGLDVMAGNEADGYVSDADLDGFVHEHALLPALPRSRRTSSCGSCPRTSGPSSWRGAPTHPKRLSRSTSPTRPIRAPGSPAKNSSTGSARSDDRAGVRSPSAARPRSGRRLWALVLSLADELGPDREWSLIGGLMVQLHAYERDDGPRPTADIDLLGGARRPPRMTEAMASLLVERGARGRRSAAVQPGPRLSLRIRRGDGRAARARWAPRRPEDDLRAEDVPGRRWLAGSAPDRGRPRFSRRRRSRWRSGRPNLLGAILIKARVVVKKRQGKYESDRQDMVRLLSYVEDPRPLAADLGRKEPGWLRDAEAAIDFEDPILSEQFSRPRLDRARQALRLLAQESYSASSTK